MIAFWLLWGVAWPPFWAWCWCRAARVFRIGLSFRHQWPYCAAGYAAGECLGRQWPAAAGGGVSLLLALAWWWWKRKDRRRAAGLIGAKARALVEALVRNMPRTVPRLVPVPVPS